MSKAAHGRHPDAGGPPRADPRATGRGRPAPVRPSGCGGSGGPALSCTADLIAAARAAATRAHAPYSRFCVGAALLADDGRIFTGANVENASYGLTVCAERVALFTAVHAGARRFTALAVAAGARTPATPCGACRQVLAEFCADTLPILCTTRSGSRTQYTTLGALLPQAFRLGKNSGFRIQDSE